MAGRFDTIGYPPGMAAGSFSKEALLDHLAGEEVSDDLIEVLRVINELGTPEAVDAMKAVADSSRVDLEAIVGHLPREPRP